MPKPFAEKIKKVREEAQEPVKNQIMMFRMKKLLSETPKKPEEKTLEEKNKEKETEKIFSQGLEAVASIGESTYAVSTRKRFDDWASHHNLKHEYGMVDRKEWNKDEPIERNGKFFVPEEEFKAHGYGAWHIGSKIDEVRKEGKDVFIIDAPRNRRFLFKEVKRTEAEK
jgi:hypothetical protein